MSFWTTEKGEALTAEKEYSAGGGDFDVIPKNTNVLVMVEDAAWKAGYEISEEFVNLKARVMKPAAYANRVLFFKLWVDDLDPKAGSVDKAKTKREKHKRMLMAIDTNAKGKLGKATSRPTDEQLALALTGAQFVATLGVWDKEDKDPQSQTFGKTIPGGNWLQAAGPKTKEVTEVTVAAKPKPAPAFDDDDLDDDVPF